MKSIKSFLKGFFGVWGFVGLMIYGFTLPISPMRWENLVVIALSLFAYKILTDEKEGKCIQDQK